MSSCPYCICSPQACACKGDCAAAASAKACFLMVSQDHCLCGSQLCESSFQPASHLQFRIHHDAVPDGNDMHPPQLLLIQTC